MARYSLGMFLSSSVERLEQQLVSMHLHCMYVCVCVRVCV